jgi:hypothetical protein
MAARRWLSRLGTVPSIVLPVRPTDTGMLTRFTGTAENKAALGAQIPLGPPNR